MTDKKRKTLDEELEESFRPLARDVAPNKRLLSGEVEDDILDMSLGTKHPKKIVAPPNKKKGLLDL